MSSQTILRLRSNICRSLARTSAEVRRIHYEREAVHEHSREKIETIKKQNLKVKTACRCPTETSRTNSYMSDFDRALDVSPSSEDRSIYLG